MFGGSKNINVVLLRCAVGPLQLGQVQEQGRWFGVRDSSRDGRRAAAPSRRRSALAREPLPASKDMLMTSTSLVCHGQGSGIQTMGLWTVTSFVPSGKVASTCTSGIISGTPSMTSLRVSRVAP